MNAPCPQALSSSRIATAVYEPERVIARGRNIEEKVEFGRGRLGPDTGEEHARGSGEVPNSRMCGGRLTSRVHIIHNPLQTVS
jgi:hypothetical protein